MEKYVRFQTFRYHRESFSRDELLETFRDNFGNWRKEDLKIIPAAFLMRLRDLLRAKGIDVPYGQGIRPYISISRALEMTDEELQWKDPTKAKPEMPIPSPYTYSPDLASSHSTPASAPLRTPSAPIPPRIRFFQSEAPIHMTAASSPRSQQPRVIPQLPATRPFGMHQPQGPSSALFPEPQPQPQPEVPQAQSLRTQLERIQLKRIPQTHSLQIKSKRIQLYKTAQTHSL
jgi:hypothetical protein